MVVPVVEGVATRVWLLLLLVEVAAAGVGVMVIVSSREYRDGVV